MAQRGINKVILIGNLGFEPESKNTHNGTAICNLRIATSETWKDTNGERQEKTEWHRVTLFGKLAEIGTRYLQKGSKVYLEGRLQTRKWQDNDGKDHYSTEIIGDQLQMLDPNPNNDRPRQAPNNATGIGRTPPAAYRPAPNQDDLDDDIPF